MRTWQLTLTPAPDEASITRTVEHDEMLATLHALTAGELPWASDLTVQEIGAPRTAPERMLAA